MVEPLKIYRRSGHLTLDIDPGYQIAYTIDDFTDPWKPSEWVVMVHGLAESGEAWYGWVPALARAYRVVRLDLRGFGQSTPVSADFPWSLDDLATDLAKFIQVVCGGPVHVIGAKIGATLCVRLAANHPGCLKTLTLIGLPVIGSRSRPGVDMHTASVREWARSSMEERLGSDAPVEMLEWWSDLMGATALSTLSGFSNAVGDFNVANDLPRIQCPVLAITTDSVRHPAAEMESWRARIPHSEAVVIPGDGYHAAATYPDRCAKAALAFIDRHSGQN